MVHVNQVGYLPGDVKKAFITRAADTFTIVDIYTGTAVYQNKITGGEYDAMSGDRVFCADFTGLDKEGEYRLETDTGEKSYRFGIRPHVYKTLKNALLKMFYYQRCGCALQEEHAGVYTHGFCHGEMSFFLHDASKKADMTGGWHDAGDYGRYATPGENALGYLLYAYELFPKAFNEKINIPESGNYLPDILNECRYELEWLLKLQDEENGGVYHKITTLRHAPLVMPEHDNAPTFIFPVSSMATAGFAACMALAYRIYTAFAVDFAQQTLDAAKRAWTWLENNPGLVKAPDNPPDGNTGDYSDTCDWDERYWAAAELYRATQDKKYHDFFTVLLEKDFDKNSYGWANVSGFGTLSYLFNKNPGDENIKEKLKTIFLAKAEELYAVYKRDKYNVSFASAYNYGWPSNQASGNNGLHFIVAALITGESRYRMAAAAHLDYLLGKNAVGMSYITGFGEHACLTPHMRTCQGDGIEAPIPGIVTGGANYRRQDAAAQRDLPEGTPPAKCYTKDYESYSTNEPSIYCNAPAFFLTAYFDR